MLMYTILYYTVLTAIIMYVLICIYIKVKFKFWSIQPVFHVYDFLYWLYPIGLVQKDFPLPNKYVNYINITVEKTDDVSDVNMKRVCNFIQCFYLRKNSIVNYIPSHSSITDYFKYSLHPSYISTYKVPLSAFHTNTKNTGDYIYNLDKLIGVFTARPLLITLQSKTFPLYYCDNLCIHPSYRKKGIAPQLIQTQYYNLRRLNKHINTFLFKREGEMTAIVPLVSYDSFVFSSDQIVANKNSNYSLNVLEINEKNIFLLTQLLTDSKRIFDCIIVPEIGTLANLLKTNHIYIYGIISNNLLTACYVFKYQHLIYNDNEHTMDCIASITTLKDNKQFFTGFKLALGEVIKKALELNRPVKRVLIENTSHNHIILHYVNRLIPHPYSRTPCAFFLYNYISYTKQPSSCFILY